jgi:hypothetical protein
MLIGVVLAMWWVWPPADEPSRGARTIHVSRAPLVQQVTPEAPPPVQHAESDNRRYLTAVAEYAEEITMDLLGLQATRRHDHSWTWSSETYVAATVVREILTDHAPSIPPFLEEGLVRHVCTYFDGTWTNEAKLKADAARVAADGFIDLADLLDSRDPLYAMLFIDLLVYSEDPMIVGKLAPLYRAFAHEEQDLFDFFEQDRLRALWRTHLNRFARFRWTIPPVYR